MTGIVNKPISVASAFLRLSLVISMLVSATGCLLDPFNNQVINTRWTDIDVSLFDRFDRDVLVHCQKANPDGSLDLDSANGTVLMSNPDGSYRTSNVLSLGGEGERHTSALGEVLYLHTGTIIADLDCWKYNWASRKYVTAISFQTYDARAGFQNVHRMFDQDGLNCLANSYFERGSFYDWIGNDCNLREADGTARNHVIVFAHEFPN